MPIKTERTSFTRDVTGRYLCNETGEVDAWKSAGGRPFDIIVVVGRGWRASGRSSSRRDC